MCSENEEAATKCKQCGQKKSDQKAICAICRQSTVIPSSNFSDSLKSGVKNVSQNTKKVYYDVAVRTTLTHTATVQQLLSLYADAQCTLCFVVVYFPLQSKPYITCSKCQTHIPIDKKDVVPHGAGAAAAARAAPAPEGEGRGSAPPAGEDASHAAAAAAPAPVSPSGGSPCLERMAALASSCICIRSSLS